MVCPCKQNASGKVSQTSFTCESKREKAGGRTVMCDGSILSCCPGNPHVHEQALKEEDVM